MAQRLSKIVADFSTSLATKVAVGGTSATLQSATDSDGNALSAGQYIFTIDGDSSLKEYWLCDVSSTAVTNIQNISRQGSLTSGSVRAHRIGASVKITNFAHIKFINDLLDGTTGFDTGTKIGYAGDPSLVSGDTYKFSTIDYVNSVAIAGGADATTSVKGISKMSTAPASPTNPIAVGDNDPRVPTQDENDALAGTSGTPSSSNKFVTNDDTATTGASKVVRSKSDSKIDDSLVALTTAGDLPYSDGTDLQRLAIGTANQVLTSSGTAPQWSDLVVSEKINSATSSSSTVRESDGEVTVYTTTIPAGTLGTSNVIYIRAFANNTQATNSNTLRLKLKYGSTTVVTATTASGNKSGFVEAYIMGTGATNSQFGAISFKANNSSSYQADLAGHGTSAEDSTGALTLSITAEFTTPANNSQEFTLRPCVSYVIL